MRDPSRKLRWNQRRAALVLALACLGAAVTCATQRGLAGDAKWVERRLEPFCLDPGHALSRYVESVGEALVEAGATSDEPRFRLLRTDFPNAFALPNGAIYVTLPMLVFLNSDDELAMILAHEIAHVRARHALRALNTRQWVKAITFLPLLPFNLVSGNVYGTAALDVTLKTHSRSEEREADEMAAESLRLAGFDLRCGVEVYHGFERLERLQQLDDSDFELTHGIWSTHPDPGDRFERILQGHAPDDAPQSCATRLLDEIDGLSVGGDTAPVVEAEDGSVYFVRDGLRVRLERNLLQYRHGWLYLDGHRFQLRRLDTDESIDAIGSRAREQAEGHEIRVFDTAPSRGRASVRVAWVSDDGPRPSLVFRHWIEIGGRIQRISAEMPPSRWRTANPLMQKLADHLEPLDLEKVRDEWVPAEYGIHEVVEGETLESLAARYLHWDATRLALRNGLDPDEPLRPGRRLKVLRRAPLHFDEPSE